jgi:SLT domain-containing protein
VQLPGRILKALSGAVGWLKNTGINIVQGLINGVTTAAKNVWKTIKGVATTIINGVKHFFGIKSPSTVFASIGGYLMKGLFKGIINNAAQLPKILGKVFGGVSRTVTGAVGALAGAGANIWESIFGGGGGGGDFSGGFSRRGGGGGAAQWAGTVSKVLSMLGQSQSLLPAVLRRINLESGGNPNAINLWDSNAKAGHPSRGLMQTIPGTFNAYAGPFRGLGITNPLANIYAGLNYAISRYGSIGAIDPLRRPYGYGRGGSVYETGSYMVGEYGPERVMLPAGSHVIPHNQLGSGGVTVVIQSKGGIDLSKYIEVKIEQADAKASRRVGMG